MDSSTVENKFNKFDKLLVSASPHIRNTDSVPKIMWNVNLALLPATIFAVINFGFPALMTVFICVSCSVLSELLIQTWQKKNITIEDGSAFLTGLLLAMCLPPNIPWYMSILGSVVAIGVAKHMMGGLGNNVFNPAHIGRALLMASYPVAMTTWNISRLLTSNSAPFSSSFFKFHFFNNLLQADSVTTATPLSILKMQGYQRLVDTFGGKMGLYKTMLIGNRAGSLGETSTILLILGGIYLIIRGYVKWQVPTVMILTVGILTWVFGGKNGFMTGDPLFHMMAGGLIIGAFFMATDMVTIPMTLSGQIIFAFGCGVITVLIRLIGGYPEGVCYAILLMNALTPMIDRFIVPKKFGTVTA
jgi:Na+-translocating ferredoxin:NAD+ oxidoreductase subunit D